MPPDLRRCAGPDPGARDLVQLVIAVLLTRAAVTGMLARAGGTVINVASLLAFSGGAPAALGLPSRAVYAATKSFLVTFSQVLAEEVLAAGIRVQVVCPGVVRSEFHSRQGMDLSAVPQLEPSDIVEASFVDLADGVVVSVPGPADTDHLVHLGNACRELLSVARTPELPPRYRHTPAS